MPEREDYDHLKWSREAEPTERRRGGGRGRGRVPDDPSAHAAGLLSQLGAAARRAENQEGFDDRILFKVRFAGKAPEELRNFPGIEVVSEEGGDLVLAFATEQGRAEFENRLRLVQRTGNATYRNVLFAMEGVDAWTPDDRTSPRLRDLLVGLRTAPTRRDGSTSSCGR